MAFSAIPIVFDVAIVVASSSMRCMDPIRSKEPELIYYECLEHAIIISGKTYPHRETLKAWGARFLGGDKTWQLPNEAETLTKIQALCSSLGGGPLNAPLFPVVAPAAMKIPSSSLEPQTMGLAETILPTSPAALTLSQLLQQVSSVVQAAFPYPVWVTGEVQNLNVRGESLYLTLAEQDPQRHISQAVTVNATLWPSVYQSLCRQHGKEALHGVLQDGMQILCRCEVSLYKGRGALSLSILEVDLSFTKGKLALEREKLMKELRSQGLDRTNKTKVLARIPLRVGLLTADGSRAASDFLHQLEEGGFPGTVLFLPVPMQGEKVVTAVARGIDQLVAAGCDVLILTRGGGSAADLRWFDGREIAYKIANCAIPIVAAIGHHDDICVAEEICFLRMKTPTAAADFIIACFQPVWLRLAECGEQLLARTDRRLQESEHQLILLQQIFLQTWQEALRRIMHTLQQLQRDLLQGFLAEILRLDRIFLRLEATLSLAAFTGLHRREDALRSVGNKLWERFQGACDTHLRKLDQLEKGLIACDPTPWCAKGWTKLTVAGKTLRSIHGVAEGEEITARLQDGHLQLQVLRKEPNANNT